MIRFVDIRGQDIGHRFAFWDTVRSEFCTFAGAQAWDDADEFAADYRASGVEFFGGLERFIGLMPAWASQEATDDELMSPDEPAADPRCAGCDIANGCPEFCRCDAKSA